MEKQKIPDQPITEESHLPEWSPPPPSSFGGREWLAMMFERFGFLLASVSTILVLVVLFLNADLLLREPDQASSQTVAEEQPAPTEGQSTPAHALNAPVEEADTTAAATVLLSVVTDPVGAALFVDGEFVGVAPMLEAVLAEGRHLISVQKPDYAQLDTVVTLNEASASFHFSLRKAEPSIAAASDTAPSAASGETERDEAPSTPVEDTESSPASNPAQTVSSPETEPASQEQTTPPPATEETRSDAEQSDDPQQSPSETETSAAVEEQQPVSVEAPVATGTLKVLAKPWGNIYIDGKLHKRETDVRYTTKLLPGTYRVRVEHPTLGIWTQNVTLVAGEERIVNVDFNPDDQ